jgi:hypothetical protein
LEIIKVDGCWLLVVKLMVVGFEVVGFEVDGCLF